MPVAVIFLVSGLGFLYTTTEQVMTVPDVGWMDDIVIIGGGAAGLFCAGIAASYGHQVRVIDHRTKIAEKIRISGGGRCNFTNIHCAAEHFLSQNPHFVKSALAGYGADDFIQLVQRYDIPFHEKKHGQLFCDDTAQDIIDMLVSECRAHGVKTEFGREVSSVQKSEQGFTVNCSDRPHHTRKLVIATGGLSIPKIGATGFGYDLARQFGMNVIDPRPALVPLTFTDTLKSLCAELSGLSVDAQVSCGKTSFAEGLLFSHRGLTGPSILQISSYWTEGGMVGINLIPTSDMVTALAEAKQSHPKQEIHTFLSQMLPKRLATALCDHHNIRGRLADIPNKMLEKTAQALNGWQVKPAGTEGYRTAEVTLGGVDTKDLSSVDMQSKTVPGLYFIGEVVDVTGHLGGHNFQWAWSSAYAAATHM